MIPLAGNFLLLVIVPALAIIYGVAYAVAMALDRRRARRSLETRWQRETKVRGIGA